MTETDRIRTVDVDSRKCILTERYGIRTVYGQYTHSTRGFSALGTKLFLDLTFDSFGTLIVLKLRDMDRG
jgi:hypothetical protein